jgi:hypothetical protein
VEKEPSSRIAEILAVRSETAGIEEHSRPDIRIIHDAPE